MADDRREQRWRVGQWAIPLEQQLGGEQPTEESWPGYSFAADVQQTVALQGDPLQGGQATGASSMPAPGPAPQLVESSTAYHNGATQTITLNNANADQLALAGPGPSVTRGFLSARADEGNPAGSIVWIAINLPATAQNAIFSLKPGGQLLLDAFVFQNDIHVACSIAPCLVVFGYSNFPNPNPST